MNTYGEGREPEFPSKWKRLGVMVIDFFVGVIFAFLFFGAVGYPIYMNLPSTTQAKENLEANSKELTNIADESKLQIAKDGALLSMKDTGKIYLTYLLKTSCFKNKIPYQELDSSNQKITIDIKEEDTFLNLDNDNLGYYFLKFKKENNIGDYINDGTNYQDKERLYLNKVILKLDSENIDLVDDNFNINNDVFYLNKQNTSWLMDYLSFNDTNSSPSNIYTKLQNIFQFGANKGIKEVENSYQRYKDIYNEFINSYNSYSCGFVWTMIICYVPGALVTFLIFPLCFKRGRTIGYRFFKMETIRINWDDFSIPLLIVRSLVQMIIESWMIIFIPIFMGRMDVLTVNLFGNVNLFMICLFTFMVTIVSLIFFAINKNDQTIADLSCQSIVVKTDNDYKESDFNVSNGDQKNGKN